MSKYSVDAAWRRIFALVKKESEESEESEEFEDLDDSRLIDTGYTAEELTVLYEKYGDDIPGFDDD